MTPNPDSAAPLTAAVIRDLTAQVRAILFQVDDQICDLIDLLPPGHRRDDLHAQLTNALTDLDIVLVLTYAHTTLARPGESPERPRHPRSAAKR